MKDLISKLEAKIQSSYEEGVTLEVAERLAGEFLHAQMILSASMKKSGLDARMRKSGVKAIRAAVYLNIVNSAEKKPTEAQITATLDSDELVSGEQQAWDTAEENNAELQRYYDIFGQAHVYFRQLAKAGG